MSNLLRLRRNLALLTSFTLIGGSIALAGLKMLRSATEVHKQATARQHELRERIDNVDRNILEPSDEIDLYRSLDERGVIGPEHRVDWIEQIRKTVERRKFLEVRYEFAPQQPWDEQSDNGSHGRVEIMSSPMRFRMALLHEFDLLRFLVDLEANVQALLRLRACTIERTPALENDETPHLMADCELDWITIRTKGLPP